MAIRTVCEPMFNKPLAEISFGQVLIGLFDTARQFEMEVQPQLVLLQKTLLYIEGLGRQLYPQLDLWATAKPFLENWVNEQMGFKALFKATKNNWPYWLEKAPELPELVHGSMRSLSQLPAMKQDLIEEYIRQQTQYKNFLLNLVQFGISSMAVLLILLFANLDNQAWSVAAVLAALIALHKAWRLR
jgi:ubiquinone biosynthesis protein